MPLDTETDQGGPSTEADRLPPDAHVRTMELLKNPPKEPMVAIMPHRGYHGSQPLGEGQDIGEHTRASIDNVVEQKFALVEVDSKFKWLVHGDTWGLTADVGHAFGLPPFNVTDTQSDQQAVNPPVAGSTWADVKDYILRTPNLEPAGEPPLNVTAVLDYVVKNQLPVNMVFDCKTPEDVRDVPKILAETNHIDEKPFIHTAMVKILLADMKTPEAFNQAFSQPGPDGKPIADSLNVVWVVRPNDVENFGSEQAIIDSLKAHRATGRFSITELNIKDDKGLHQVADYVRESGQPWLGSYHPTRESNLLQDPANKLGTGNWNNITDKDTLYKLGEEKVLFMPNGTCCHSINSDLYGSDYDQRPSLARLQGLGVNFITTDTPGVARDFFNAQGIPDISDVVRQQAGRQPSLPGPSGSNGGSYFPLLAGVVLAGGAAYLCVKKQGAIQRAIGAAVRWSRSVTQELCGTRDLEAGAPLRRDRARAAADDHRPQQRAPRAPRPAAAQGQREHSPGMRR